jgi:hypothetical protein
MFLAATRLHTIPDIEIRIGLAAIFAVLAGLTIMGFAGAFMAGQGAGPFFWFAVGVGAYWLVGPGRTQPPEGGSQDAPRPRRHTGAMRAGVT